MTFFSKRCRRTLSQTRYDIPPINPAGHNTVDRKVRQVGRIIMMSSSTSIIHNSLSYHIATTTTTTPPSYTASFDSTDRRCLGIATACLVEEDEKCEVIINNY